MTLRVLLFLVFAAPAVYGAGLRSQALEAMKKGAAFYHEQVSTEGGYHFHYAADLSYGRSESAEGSTQVSVQRDGTPAAGMAFLDAWHATGDQYYLDAAVEAARALVKGQLCSGGWTYIIEFDPAKRRRYAYRSDGNCRQDAENTTVLDDNVSQAAARLLMRVDRALDFRDEAIHGAAGRALEALIGAQYPNGAWPQRFSAPPEADNYPVKQASYPDSWPREHPGDHYREYYTFNDNTIADAIDMFLEAARTYGNPDYRAAAERGGGFILLAQMPDPQPAWAQQYDLGMHPAWARVFEPPSVTGGESQGIMRTLLALYRETGDRKYLEPIPRGFEYLKRSIVPPSDAEIYRRASRGGGPVLARFYELKTNRPLYITKGTQIRVPGLGSSRPDGYKVSYSDASVITHYSVLVSGRDLAAIEAEYNSLAAAEPASIRRPERLHGLSPWQGAPRPRPSAQEVEAIVNSLDSRGAWVEDDYIGKADRAASVFAARDMTVRIGDRTYPLKENETVEVFFGAAPPLERVINTRTFAANLIALARFVE